MNTVDLVASFAVVLLIAWGVGGAVVLLWIAAATGYDWIIRCQERREFNKLTRGLR